MVEEPELCNTHEVHADNVDAARGSIPDGRTTLELSDFFRIFGDDTRLRILFALENGELCVCDIGAVLGMSVSAVSHQLRILRDAHLVTVRREGRSAYYSLCDDHVKTIVDTALEHIRE